MRVVLATSGCNPTPRGRHIPPAGFDHHSRAALAGTVYMQTIAAHVHHLTRRGIRPHVRRFRRQFVDHPEQSEDDDKPDQRG